jgi:hypothetical protein
MTARLVRLVLVVVLVLSAGCAGLFGPSTETLTPAPVPHPTPTPESPPGVTSGSVDVITLLAVDRRVRANTSHRLEQTILAETANGSLRVEQVRRASAGGQAAGTLRIEGSEPYRPALERGWFWQNGTLLLVQTRLSSGREVTSQYSEDRQHPYDLTRGVVEQVLSTANLSVSHNDREQTVLRSTEPLRLPAAAMPVASGAVRNVTARAVVSDEGLVRSVRIRYQGVSGGEPVQVTLRERVTATDETTVTRPGWVPASGPGTSSENGTSATRGDAG